MAKSKALVPVQKKKKMTVKKAPRRFRPPTAREVAKNADKLKLLNRERTIVEKAMRGQSYESISDEYGISVKEAFDTVQKAVEKWMGELSLNANQIREMDVRRLEALIANVWSDAEPHEVVEIDAEGKAYKRMVPANLLAVKVVKELMECKHNLLGLKINKVELSGEVGIRREYSGVDLNSL